MKRLLFGIGSRWNPLGIPLAWRQLAADPKRFAAALAGIVVAVVMMLFQLGLYDALFATVVRPITVMSGDLMLISSDYGCLASAGTFSERNLAQARADEAVSSTALVLCGPKLWRNPWTGQPKEIFILGCEPGEHAFELPGFSANRAALTREDEVLFDLRSRKEFGDIAEALKKGNAVETEVGGRRVRVAGLVDLGVTFAADGNLITGTMAFHRLVPDYPRGQASIGLIRLRPGADARKVQSRLRTILPAGLRLLTKRQLIAFEKEYWARRTPIGFVITASMTVGILVGAIIIYQILYTDVSDHLTEYATLKAIGFPGRFFNRLIVHQSFLLSVLGFVPGAVLALALFQLTIGAAHLPMRLTPGGLAGVYLLTLFICILAGWLAAAKLRQADPAEAFA